MTTARIAAVASSAVLAAIGAAAVFGGIGYGMFGEEGRIGPGFLPALSGGLVAFFAIGDIVGRLRARTGPSEVALILGEDAEAVLEAEQFAESDVDIFGRSQKQRTRMLVAVLGILILTLLAVPLFGFILAFGLMLIAIAVLVERRNWLPSVAVSVVACAVTYAVFVVLLRVPLPQGLIGII